MSGAVAQGQRKGDFLAGKYLLEDCLGIGGMGEVYRATNVSLGRKVAIKLLSPEYVNIEEDVLRFLREARAAAAVRHTNVVDVLDVARDDDGTPFIVQELLAGEDLEHYLRRRGGRLSADEALEIMIPVADAVAAAHSHDVVHRDLKPANIFLSRDRNKITPKVLDFGACLFPTIAERSKKEVRMLIGTPHYMAPEQIVSKADVDARSDVWALGIILYEMLVGETPFEAETANAVLQLVKTRDVPKLRARVKDAPSELEELIDGCTKRDRLKRLPDAGAVHDAMLRIRGTDRSVRPPRALVDTLTEGVTPVPPRGLGIPTLNLNDIPTKPPANAAPDLPPPAKVAPLVLPRGGLLTLNSPGSEPPNAEELELDLPLPKQATDVRRDDLLVRKPHVNPSQPPVNPSRTLEDDDELGLPRDLALAARPSSWPPAGGGGASKRGEVSNVKPATKAQVTPFHDVDLGLDLNRGINMEPRREPRVATKPPPKQGGATRAKDAGPPNLDMAPAPERRSTSSSIPPVLDPRAAQKAMPKPAAEAAPPVPKPAALPKITGTPPDAAETQPATTESSPPAPASLARPPAVVAKEKDFVRVRAKGGMSMWSIIDTIRFVALVAGPAVFGFIAILVVPAFGRPLGGALRGDSTVASGLLAVAALVCAAALCARSLLGKRDRLIWVAAGGMLLFGIAMIIVTFSASEAAELGVPAAMGGLSTILAPIAPLALALRSLAQARDAWIDPYSKGDAIRAGCIASLMLFLTLALSPMGAVRTPARPPQVLRGIVGS